MQLQVHRHAVARDALLFSVHTWLDLSSRASLLFHSEILCNKTPSQIILFTQSNPIRIQWGLLRGFTDLQFKISWTTSLQWLLPNSAALNIKRYYNTYLIELIYGVFVLYNKKTKINGPSCTAYWKTLGPLYKLWRCDVRLSSCPFPSHQHHHHHSRIGIPKNKKTQYLYNSQFIINTEKIFLIQRW